ncbi:MAG: hypothetical protein CME62_12140 [Halobacteriovoraceae bacterium]|nr:hypothetical protein [Halobacteriovoraceae bacterium]|tara:strand:+ start:4323 stop:5006 length:684 start_codon:yes stop_codon:yes gene_type:complete
MLKLWISFLYLAASFNAQAQHLNLDFGQQATCQIKNILNMGNGVTNFSEQLTSFLTYNQNFYKLCMEKVNKHSYCITAGRGAIDCLDSTSRTEQECHSAQPGFYTCINDNQSEETCLRASASYGSCIRYESSQACLQVTDGYSQCLIVSGYNSERCNGTALDYKQCIYAGYSHGQCLNSYGGMMSCLEAGLSPNLCQLGITQTQMECYNELHDVQKCHFPNNLLLHL